MPSTFTEMKRNIEDGWEDVLWSESYGWGDAAAVAACTYFGCVQVYLEHRLDRLLEKVGREFLEQVIRNKGQVLTGPGELQVQAGDAYYSVYHNVWNPFRGRHEKVTTERYIRLFVRYRRVTDGASNGSVSSDFMSPPPVSQVLLQPRLAEGNWSTLRSPFELHVMGDGNVLGWNRSSGDFILWRYDVSHLRLLPERLKANRWCTLKAPFNLHVMRDGNVLGWNRFTGEFILWRYDHNHDKLLPERLAQSTWNTLKTPFHLKVMGDGNLLAWNRETGEFILFRYDVDHERILPARITQGRWNTLKAPFQLHVMSDGNLMGWNAASGEFILWTYDVDDDRLLHHRLIDGTFVTLREPCDLRVMSDGNVLGWEQETGDFILWKYNQI